MIVPDANILIRAVLGRRVRQLIETYGSPLLWAGGSDLENRILST